MTAREKLEIKRIVCVKVCYFFIWLVWDDGGVVGRDNVGEVGFS